MEGSLICRIWLGKRSKCFIFFIVNLLYELLKFLFDLIFIILSIVMCGFFYYWVCDCYMIIMIDEEWVVKSWICLVVKYCCLIDVSDFLKW